MKINCGIIGLPNVGKSTLFKFLTNVSVKIDNFPFSTIKPNFAVINIPDMRLYKIQHITQSKIVVPEKIEFIDIAGLIKGAATGEGLGNKILSYIKTTKILCHVIRCFDNELIIHIKNYVDPNRDLDIINTEFILFDILECEKKIATLQKNYNNNQYIDQTIYILKKCLHSLYNGIVLRKINFSNIEIEHIKELNFLTIKPIIYIANVDEKNINNIHFKKLQKIGLNENIPVIPYCAINSNKLKYQSNNNDYFLNTIINNIISLLQLNTFFTVNTNMARAWLCSKGTIALNAARYVHSDFKKGFIRVQVIKLYDFFDKKGELGAKKFGKIHFAGKNYKIENEDILKFLFQN